MTQEDKIKYSNIAKGAGFAYIAGYIMLKTSEKSNPKDVRTAMLVAGVLFVIGSVVFSGK